MQVLDERENQKSFVGHVPDDDRHIRPLESLNGPEAAFPGHELVPLSDSGVRADEKRLQKPILSD